jgi:septal ring factor EnvC (AmiA/AmiB activator)
MSGDNPTLKDIWRLLGTMNKRFDVLERQVVQVRAELTQQIGETRSDLAALKAEMRLGFSAIKASIEARDFRLDDHGRRLTELESRS